MLTYEQQQKVWPQFIKRCGRLRSYKHAKVRTLFHGRV